MIKSEILNLMFTLGNVDDCVPLYSESFVKSVKGKLCGDRKYIGKTLFKNLFINRIQLITKVKTSMKNMLMTVGGKIILRKRAVIESGSSYTIRGKRRQKAPISHNLNEMLGINE